MRTQHIVPPVSLSELSPIGKYGVTSAGNNLDTEKNTKSKAQLNESDDPKISLKNLKTKHRDRPIIAQLNIFVSKIPSSN